MSRTTRGQVSGPTIPIGLFIAVAVIGIAVNSLSTVTDIRPAPGAGNLCSIGVFGCEGAALIDVVVPALIITALVAISFAARLRLSSERGGAE